MSQVWVLIMILPLNVHNELLDDIVPLSVELSKDSTKRSHYDVKIKQSNLWKRCTFTLMHRK